MEILNDLEKLFGIHDLIVQKRANFYAVFTFDKVEECKKILHDLSHDPDLTLVYYRGEVLTSRQFANEYGGYVYEPDDGYVNNVSDGSGKKEGCSTDSCPV